MGYSLLGKIGIHPCSLTVQKKYSRFESICLIRGKKIAFWLCGLVAPSGGRDGERYGDWIFKLQVEAKN